MKNLKLFYYNKIPNFGDRLNIDLFYKLFNTKVQFAPVTTAEYISVGSLMEFYLKKTSFKKYFHSLLDNIFTQEVNVLGTGFISAQKNEKESFRKNLNFYAVRGKLTQKRIEKIQNKSYDDLVLGDPGLLAPFLLEREKVSKKYKLGIIPHYMDKQEPCILKIAESLDNSILIDVLEQPLEVIKKIAECEAIISTSLHGLIIADSFNIPNIWAIASNKLYGGEYKFKDYYSVYNIDEPQPINLNITEFNENNIEDITKKYVIAYNNVKIVQDQLIKVFSFLN